ncbi:MAG: hypothetical protein ACRCZA_04150, partial [Shewanella sp.]|uniref:hypothetical protein n=1 Tax=Shewanella sp. TaxID=50422 RepID=UPI003F3D9213
CAVSMRRIIERRRFCARAFLKKIAKIVNFRFIQSIRHVLHTFIHIFSGFTYTLAVETTAVMP